MSEAHAVVISDLHLGPTPKPRTAAALGRLLERHPGAELILNGDVFELSMFPAARPPAAALDELLTTHADVARHLRAHVARGSQVTFVAGNHDAALVGLGAQVATQLGDPRGKQVNVAPWFVRRGAVHVEHGHVYDPDNAPLHPLADWAPRTEPVGIALMRRFIRAAGAYDFAHAHDTTPLRGVKRAFDLYGAATPWLVARYFATAFGLCWEASWGRQMEKRTAWLQGVQSLENVALTQGIDATRLAEIERVLPAPTHARWTTLAQRLYLDRITSGALGAGSGVALLLGGGLPAFAVLAPSALYCAYSAAGKRPKRPEVRLREAALTIAPLLDVKAVVFGHTHVEETHGPYHNPGSFTYCREGAHPYALLLGDRVEHGRLNGESNKGLC